MPNRTERLDASAAASIWRSVDTSALARAFSTLSSQELSFDRCDLNVSGARATARCNGQLRYVRRFGDAKPQQRRMSWNIQFERSGERWFIAGLTAQ